MTNVSIIRIYFPFATTTVYTTDLLYTWQEILGNFGGMLGLCIGLSISGAIEMVYFATIKLVQNIFCARSKWNRSRGSAAAKGNFSDVQKYSSKEIEKAVAMVAYGRGLQIFNKD